MSNKRVVSVLVPVLVSLGFVGEANAYRYVGDLVYCDVDANGIYDAGDYPLDGVEVLVECLNPDGDVCVSTTAVTGTLHPSVAQDTPGGASGPGRFMERCGDYVAWDATDESTLAGRYAVEVSLSGCGDYVQPWDCTITLDTSTLPSSCDVLVTPELSGYPYDGNDDGDFCDAEDGPFPEGQTLGNLDYLTCEEAPDAAPSDNQYTVEFRGDICNVQNDFGYTPGLIPGATRTPGFWKTHPWAVEAQLPIEFCGETIDEICRAVELLSTRGGGFGQFTRHAVAASLNCSAFGCPDGIADLLSDANLACAQAEEMDWGDIGDALDEFNNSGTEIDDDLDRTGADPHYCWDSGFSGILPDMGGASAGCAAAPMSSLALLGVVLLWRRRAR